MSDITNISAGTYLIDASHSRIGFSARHAMITKVRGSFNQYEGAAIVNSDGTANIDLTIQVASIDTRSADRDGHLQSADFFDVAAFPTIRFASTSAKVSGTDKVAITGDLTIRDVTKSITIDFEYSGTATDLYGNVRVGFEGSSAIERKDYGLVWNAALETGGVIISDKINLEFEISAIAVVAAA